MVSELARRIKEVAAQVRLPLEDDEHLVEVEVLENYLPEDLFENTSYVPFVLVEFLEVSDDLKEGSTAHIGLTIGTYSEEEDGWLRAFHLMQVIRQDLLERRVIAKRFRLESARWQAPDTQPAPFYYLVAELTFNIFQPLEQIGQVC
ncbi:MAG: hypothetical protein SR1Q5_00825 [Quinella sp. 1Q5]|nr:hypothetical protein [Quinella sp. 1Q5]